MSTDIRPPLLPDASRQRMAHFVDLFRTGDFDTIRAMLADDVKLDLVSRFNRQGRDTVAPYFARYAEATKWRFALGAIEGRPAMLVFESGRTETPSHFVLVDWHGDRICAIRDFLFAGYALESADWV